MPGTKNNMHALQKKEKEKRQGWQEILFGMKAYQVHFTIATIACRLVAVC